MPPRLPHRPVPMLNPVRAYDWGSRTALAALQERDPGAGPEAELWMGAHPGDPSSVEVDGTALPLDRALPRRLPYLLKVLTIDRALSVQVHPSDKRSAVEHAAGNPAYVDPYGKPEFLYALTPFEALAGFRDPADAARLAALLGLPALDALFTGWTASRAVMIDVLARLVHRPAAEREAFSAAAVARAGELLTDPDLTDDDRAAFGIVLRLGGEHPGDVLVVAPLLLRLHHLPVGGTIFLPTGVPHAYLGGSAVEIMATSDNVLRAGLTTKAVDVDELLASLDPDADAHVAWPGGAEDGIDVWRVPVPDFTLARLDVETEISLPGRLPGPHVVLVTRGAVEVSTADGTLAVAQGRSAFLPDGCTSIRLRSTGSAAAEAFVACPGPAAPG